MIILRIFNQLISLILIGLIRIYQGGISPYLPAACRHVPSCSAYTIEAVRRFGPLYGGLLGANRIVRCNPFGTQGFDPVPVIRIKKRFYWRLKSVSRLKGHQHHPECTH